MVVDTDDDDGADENNCGDGVWWNDFCDHVRIGMVIMVGKDDNNHGGDGDDAYK
jgi:hypothetical protein